MNIERGLNNSLALYYLCFGQLTFFKQAQTIPDKLIPGNRY